MLKTESSNNTQTQNKHMKNQKNSKFGIFYKSHGRWTKTPYLGETYTASGIETYKKDWMAVDRANLKSRLTIRKLRKVS